MAEHIIISDIIHHPVEKVWEKLIAFDQFSDIHPATQRSFYRHYVNGLQGSIRRIDMPNDDYVEELLVNLDSTNYYLEYIILNSSLPLSGYRSEIKLHSITQYNETFIQWEAWFTTTADDPAAFSAEIKNNVFAATIHGLDMWIKQQK